jgi:[glutamine synthetase] adenylyltransferase / [glutamine synthetase]-adenylyl-L-tyrosine phosphorylase
VTSPEVLGRVLAAAPDPEQARVALSRVGESPEVRGVLGEPVALEHAARLLGASTAAADFLVAHPEEAGLFLDPSARDRGALVEEARRAVAELGLDPGLRRFRRRALFRVAVRDLADAPVEKVMAEVTSVAEACLEVAAAEAGGGLAVIGLGKLGGRELNYSSDVDVVFVHEGTGGDAQSDASRRAARVVASLSEPTADGVALRVDPTLRPEGRAGPLSRSAVSTTEYYRRHAATWERQAWLKARPVAGDRALGAALIGELEPVIFPEHLETSAIEDVRAMKVRIEEYVRASGKEAVEVKRGRGGIRDVEFAVQLLQLVHARRDPALREPNTLRALAALGDRGYVAERDAEELASSYRFLRRLEHRLQLARELQTHELPTDERALRPLARSLGLGGPDDLRSAFADHTEVVRTLHERLFYRPLLDRFAGKRAPVPGTEPVATEELLAGLGFANPAGASRRFERLVAPDARVGRVLAHVFPVVAPALALAADPDGALVRFERVVDGLRRNDSAADALLADVEAAPRLARTVAGSAWASDALAARPDVALHVISPAAGPESPEEGLLRAVADHAEGRLPVPDSGRALSRVAGTAIAEAVDEAAPHVPIAVIGLGKLGSEELNFASDLDVVFVYDGEGAAAFEEARRAAEAILDGIRARGFEPDPDLRPEGRNGPLARSMAAYLEYWERWGQTWEFQSLLKARAVAGDELLGKRFVLAAEDFAYPEVLPVDREAEIRRMRVRMEEERVRPPDARRFHFKLGHGGLADVQFAVELAQLRHGSAHPPVRRRHTLEALEALARERLLEDGVALALGEASVFLNEVKNALEVDRRVPAEALPPSPEAQLALARRLGYEEFPRASFLEDYRRITRRARRAMERVFYGDEEG